MNSPRKGGNILNVSQRGANNFELNLKEGHIFLYVSNTMFLFFCDIFGNVPFWSKGGGGEKCHTNRDHFNTKNSRGPFQHKIYSRESIYQK